MSRQEKENVNMDVKTVTDKESGATAIYYVVKADLIHSGATEEIAELGAMKAMCAFETAWSMSVDKACELIKLHIGVDLPVRLSPDGQPLAEDFINHAEERAEAAQKVVGQFRKAMQ